jgi:hypothetical protein
MINLPSLNQLADRLRLNRKCPVFIVGRFRSGTTALWNIFRRSDEALALYEPLHDTLNTHLEHPAAPDATHRGVTDYFHELRLHREEILPLYRMEFGATRLALSAKDSYPELKTYLSALIDLAGEKVPVIKCVRLDFRLAWLRRHFPQAVIIYLVRSPREQWISMAAKDNADLKVPRWLSVYQGSVFATNLMFVLPELMGGEGQHAYERAYYLWRISQVIGQKYADLYVDFDREFLSADPALFARLASLTGIPIPPQVIEECLHRDIPRRASSDDLNIPFAKIEQRCETVLERRGLLRAIQEGVLDNHWPLASDLTPTQITEAINSLSLASSREQQHTLEVDAALAEARLALQQAQAHAATLQEELDRSRTIKP